MQVPDGTVWTGPYPVAPGRPPRDVVVRVRSQGWTSVGMADASSHRGSENAIESTREDRRRQ